LRFSLQKVKVTLRLKVSQSVSLGIEPHLGLMTRYLLPFDSYGLVLFCVGALSDERTGLSFVHAVLALASAVFLATIFYCLRFETSLFVASYDSQGHGGGIRPRLHTSTFLLNNIYKFSSYLTGYVASLLPVTAV
jgi:hypothetical protein